MVLVREPGYRRIVGPSFDRPGELGVLPVLLERAGANEVAPFHVEVVLRRGERVRPLGLLDRGRRDPEAAPPPGAVCVHARAVADAAGARAPVAEMQRDDARRAGRGGSTPGAVSVAPAAAMATRSSFFTPSL